MIVGLGIDAIDIDRIARMYADKGDRMLQRLFRPDELKYLSTKLEPAQHLAVRLAAKEATYKALAGNELARGIGWRDVEVLTRGESRPRRPSRTMSLRRSTRRRSPKRSTTR